MLDLKPGIEGIVQRPRKNRRPALKQIEKETVESVEPNENCEDTEMEVEYLFDISDAENNEQKNESNSYYMPCDETNVLMAIDPMLPEFISMRSECENLDQTNEPSYYDMPCDETNVLMDVDPMLPAFNLMPTPSDCENLNPSANMALVLAHGDSDNHTFDGVGSSQQYVNSWSNSIEVLIPN